MRQKQLVFKNHYLLLTSICLFCQERFLRNVYRLQFVRATIFLGALASQHCFFVCSFLGHFYSRVAHLRDKLREYLRSRLVIKIEQVEQGLLEKRSIFDPRLLVGYQRRLRQA